MGYNKLFVKIREHLLSWLKETKVTAGLKTGKHAVVFHFKGFEKSQKTHVHTFNHFNPSINKDKETANILDIYMHLKSKCYEINKFEVGNIRVEDRHLLKLGCIYSSKLLVNTIKNHHTHL